MSEQQFEASLAASAGDAASQPLRGQASKAAMTAHAGAMTAVQEEANPVDQTAYWREEVTSRVERYRARRKRPPCERSLSLDFERAVNREAISRDAADTSESSVVSAQASAEPPARSDDSDEPLGDLAALLEQGPAEPAAAAEELVLAKEAGPAGDLFSCGDRQLATSDSNVIEFPRQPIVMPPSVEELAEPVIDKPRILEVPEEVETARSPLGGISLEPEEEEAPELEFELPLRVASMSQRVFSGLLDALLVILASAMFFVIVARSEVPMPQGKAMLMLLAAPALFWAVYQYLFLVHAGTTPGMRMAHLALVSFDGHPVCRRVRRGRAVATVLSCLSLGLGLVWALLDEDTLCWHDRISRTYVVENQ